MDIAQLPGLCPRGGADPAHNRGQPGSSHSGCGNGRVHQSLGRVMVCLEAGPRGPGLTSCCHKAVSASQHRKSQGLAQRGHNWPSRDAAFLLTHFSLFLVFLGFTQGISNPLSCRRNRGVCLPIRCPGSMRQIGTCFRPRVKCCRRW